MLVNQNTAVSTAGVLLVPYESHHVPTYHEWMKDEDIQQATASEPLSIEEEYEMQQSWRKDSDKLTFIACLPRDPKETTPASTVSATVDDAPDRMIGDVNLFLSPAEDEDEFPNHCVGEIELMIAPVAFRGQGRGRATALAFLQYVHQHLSDILDEYSKASSSMQQVQLQHLRVKIGSGNNTSIKLFTSLGFKQIGEANYFGEVEFHLLDFIEKGVPSGTPEGYNELVYSR